MGTVIGLAEKVAGSREKSRSSIHRKCLSTLACEKKRKEKERERESEKERDRVRENERELNKEVK